MRIYDEFARAVTDKVLSATKQEKAAIRRELLEHLEDHAADLTERGWSETEAAELAVASMGDPEEIGRALDRNYSRLWYVLASIANVLFVVALIFSAFPLFMGFTAQAEDMWVSRQAASYVSDKDIMPMDVKINAANGQILRLYGVSYDVCRSSVLDLQLYFITYDRHPWHNASSDLITLLDVCDSEGNHLPNATWFDAFIDDNTCREAVHVIVDAPVDEVILKYDAHGQRFSQRVSIPAPEKLPPTWKGAPS